MVNRHVVGAHYGLKDWLAQRITGVYMAVFTPVFAACTLCMSEFSHAEWSKLFASPFVRFSSFLFVLALCYHAWVGVRDIWMDYVKSTGLRLVLHVLTLFVLVGYAGWAIRILWRL